MKKTAEEIIKSIAIRLYSQNILKAPITQKGQLELISNIDAIEDSAISDLKQLIQQELEQAVEVALRVASENMDWEHCYDGGCHCAIVKHENHILSLAPQIMEELNLPTPPQT